MTNVNGLVIKEYRTWIYTTYIFEDPIVLKAKEKLIELLGNNQIDLYRYLLNEYDKIKDERLAFLFDDEKTLKDYMIKQSINKLSEEK